MNYIRINVKPSASTYVLVLEVIVLPASLFNAPLLILILSGKFLVLLAERLDLSSDPLLLYNNNFISGFVALSFSEIFFSCFLVFFFLFLLHLLLQFDNLPL